MSFKRIGVLKFLKCLAGSNVTKLDTHKSIPDEHDGLSRSSRADQFSKGNKLELKLLLRIIKMGFAIGIEW